MGYWATEWYYDCAPEIPRSVSRHVGADRIHRVLGYYCAKADDDTAEACPSQREIAERLGGMDRRDVRAAITALEDLGLIVPVAPAIKGVRGVTYKLQLAQFPGYEVGGVPPRIPARLGRGAPPTDAGHEVGGVPPQVGGVTGQSCPQVGGVVGGVPRHNQKINTNSSNSPGLVSARGEPVESLNLTTEDLDAISSRRVREVVAHGAGLKREKRPRHPTPPGLEPLETLAQIAARGGMG